MTQLSTPAIIVIVIVACLAVVSLGAALTRQLYPAHASEAQFQPSRDQDLYMRSVRQRTMDRFHRASIHARDLESQYASRDASYYISSENMTTAQWNNSSGMLTSSGAGASGGGGHGQIQGPIPSLGQGPIQGPQFSNPYYPPKAYE